MDTYSQTGKLVQIMSFTTAHEAHIVKGKLESEGVDAELYDELTTQVYNLYSNAFGGIKLMVHQAEIIKAKNLLLQWGYLREETSDTADPPFLFSKATPIWKLIAAALLITAFISALALLQDL